MADGQPVQIRLLGGFAVSIGDAEVPDGAWRLRKARTLVMLLALAPGHRLHWEQVGEVLWPEREEAAVRNSFHQALRAARDALTSAGVDGRQVLRLRDGVVSFGDDIAVAVDVEEFTAAVEHARTVGDLEAYRTAADRYAGELLPEDRDDDWVDARREALREQYAALRLEMAQRHRDRGDAAAAIEGLRRLLIDHELHEPARRELMRLLADTGRCQEALAEYESLRDALRASLEADSDAETRWLYRRLLAGSLEGEEPEPVAPAAASRPSGNLPVAASSFVGRDREIDAVE